MATARIVAPPAHHSQRNSMRDSDVARSLPPDSRRMPRPTQCLPRSCIVQVDTDCTLEYIDVQPSIACQDCRLEATLVLLHGAPGTYHDFRYLLPHLQQQIPTARIIGINFPGFGGSKVDDSRYVELLYAQRAAQLTLKALHRLVADDANVFLVGHSFGGHAALTLAALNLNHSTSTHSLRIRGLVLLAAAGTKPHRVLQPRGTALLVDVLQTVPSPIRGLVSLGIKLFYTVVLPFPSSLPTSHFVAGVVRAGTTDFDEIRRHVASLRAAGVPSFSAWSSDDGFMEEAVPTALAQALGSSKRIAFASAGHNLQKTRADVVAIEIKQWIDQVLRFGDVKHTGDTCIESRL